MGARERSNSRLPDTTYSERGGQKPMQQQQPGGQAQTDATRLQASVVLGVFTMAAQRRSTEW